MALKILKDFGRSMRWDLVTSVESFGMDYMPSIVSPTGSQGQWELRIDYTFPNDTNGYFIIQ